MLTISRLSLEDARCLIEGAADKSREIGVPMCITVTDESGMMIAFERMDGGKVSSAILSQDKAFTAATSRKPTHEVSKLAQPGQPLYSIGNSWNGRFTLVGGGYPVVVKDEIVGSIACSSGTVPQDMACSEAGLEKFYKTLG